MTRRDLRAGALELAADALEQLAEAAGRVLREAAGADPHAEEDSVAFAGPADDSVHRSTDTLPMPEEGDRLSGLARETAIRGGAIPPADGITEQDGHTEEEWEDLSR